MNERVLDWLEHLRDHGPCRAHPSFGASLRKQGLTCWWNVRLRLECITVDGRIYLRRHGRL
mgnify:CR=1 FL=1